MFPIARRFVERVLLVSDAANQQAQQLLWERLPPAGAVADTGSCHYGATRVRVGAAIPPQATRGTRTFCAGRGALWAHRQPAALSTLKTRTGQVYRWQRQRAAHHCCGGCGCAAESDSPALGRNGGWQGNDLACVRKRWRLSAAPLSEEPHHRKPGGAS